MTTRHRAREVALQVLYGYDVLGTEDGKNIQIRIQIQPHEKAAHLALELRKHFDHFQITENLRKFAAQLVAGTLQEIQALDATIEKNTPNWKLARMPLIDRTLLRMAAYELLYLPETPPSVVINEAIELAKEFGNAETPAFINGVLDGIRKSSSN